MSYRNNVCAVIRKKPDNSVLICHRKNYPENEGWQFPQGGIDINLDFISELKRELFEEIGNDDIKIISISTNTYKYDYPAEIQPKYGNYSGQQQRWVLAEFNNDNTHPVFNGEKAEFDDFKWVTPAEALFKIVKFKKDVYQRALSDLGILELKRNDKNQC